MTPDRGPLTLQVPIPLMDFMDLRRKLSPVGAAVYKQTVRIVGLTHGRLAGNDEADQALLTALEADGWEIVVTRQRR